MNVSLMRLSRRDGPRMALWRQNSASIRLDPAVDIWCGSSRADADDRVGPVWQIKASRLLIIAENVLGQQTTDLSWWYADDLRVFALWWNGTMNPLPESTERGEAMFASLLAYEFRINAALSDALLSCLFILGESLNSHRRVEGEAELAELPQGLYEGLAGRRALAERSGRLSTGFGCCDTSYSSCSCIIDIESPNGNAVVAVHMATAAFRLHLNYTPRSAAASYN
ncbi:hypothetical protein NUW54_g837 [Trametes sanguinea]|uniref:Uncharacterized protein n=1 Tax=Trametes sanguinea TaxID=158606 RepID=A0ACC1Q897_9APHY|nr:hypothetical protein NUW54_g837 [Trametes sanguinea]